MIFQDLNNITDVYAKDGSVIEKIYNQTGDIIWEKNIFDIYDVTTDPYYTQYFTITPTNGSDISITCYGNKDNLYYKVITGNDWNKFESDKMVIETSVPYMFKQDTDYPIRFLISRVSGSGTYDVSGNIMSLMYGDDFIGKTELKGNGTFWYLLRYGPGHEGKLINAENLILPATTLTDKCYLGMFADCYYLKTTPKILPATTLTYCCYWEMFDGCIQIEKAPLLPATTLTNCCYWGMFNRCTSLNYIKMLATDISAPGCLNWWVSAVASSGTFVKNSTATWNVTGENGIPTGWTIISE